jgi:transposase
MRYELSDYEWSVIRPMLQQAAWRSPSRQPAHSQRHFLGVAVRSAAGAPAWSLHRRQQSPTDGTFARRAQH